jgi:glycosyltransferase involved in cell wall biosynthesis
MPIVATPAAMDGTLQSGEAMIAATPQAFAQAILDLYKNEELWQAQAASSLRAMARYTAENLENQVWSVAR